MRKINSLKIISALIFLLPISGFSQGIDKKSQSIAVSEIKSKLKDPMSAIFEKFSSFKDAKNYKRICGNVNAKNSYGGYVGFVPFLVVTIADVPLESMLGTDEATVTHILNACDKRLMEFEAAEEQKALCKENSTSASPDPCGALISKCEDYQRRLNEKIRPEFFKYCRRNGIEAASDKWSIPKPIEFK